MSTTTCGTCGKVFEGLYAYLPAHDLCIKVSITTNKYAKMLSEALARMDSAVDQRVYKAARQEYQDLLTGYTISDYKVYPIERQAEISKKVKVYG